MHYIILFLAGWMILSCSSPVFAQKKAPESVKPVTELFYFHTSERCPIDQSIEEHTRKLVQTEFSAAIKDGLLRFQVINTADPKFAATIARFDINAQALYLVSYSGGKEVKKDLTGFAFSNAQDNPGKFRMALRDDIHTAMKGGR